PSAPPLSNQALLCRRTRLMREPPHIGGQNVQLSIRQLTRLGWHFVDLTLVDHRSNGLFAPAVQPDVIGQIGGTQGLVTLAVHAVARCARSKLGLAQGSA